MSNTNNTVTISQSELAQLRMLAQQVELRKMKAVQSSQRSRANRIANMNEDELEVIITPTYTGCPAMDMITATIKIQLATLGFKKVKVTQILSPAWTTEWMSEEGKRKLKEYGIAPPNPKQQVCDQKLFAAAEAVQCPHCDSYHTHRISEFGSTACKALYQCDDCKEPFDYFKCH